MNKNLFQSNPGNVKDADTTNEAGGRAYQLSDKEALCQYVLTGTLNNTFYTRAEDQLKTLIELCGKVEYEFIAKLAIYARQNGRMKDTPAFLIAYLAAGAKSDIVRAALFQQAFPRVIDNAKMLRNFMTVIRSGALGRKSFGSMPKRLINNFLNGMSDERLFNSNIGNEPSLPDIIKMTHPKAPNKERNTLYAYLIGKEPRIEKGELFGLARDYEAFKSDLTKELPPVPFLMLTALPLSDEHYKTLALRCTWDQLRQNLNNFARHNVFNDKEVVQKLAAKLSNPEEVRRARVFPYQLFTTFYHADESLPIEIKMAIQDAAEVALENTPKIEGDIEICLDVSGSMSNPATGHRGTATSKMSFVQVGAMFAAAIIRKNALAKITPFDTAVRNIAINPKDSVATNAEKLAIHGGGTDCGCALAYLNAGNRKADAVMFISDNQSWVQSSQTRSNETPMMREWQRFKERNPKAKLVNLDIAPYGTSQAQNDKDILQVGGFSDAVFDVVADFLNGKTSNMVEVVDKVALVEEGAK